MTDVYTSALSGIKSSKAELALNAHNVANADVEGYTRLTLNKEASFTGGNVSGVSIEGISTLVDETLHDVVYGKISTNELHQTIKNYYDRIHQSMGSPERSDSIDAAISGFYNGLEVLAANPNSASLKVMAIQDATNLTNKISDLAKSLEGMRFEIDHQISREIDDLNSELSNAYRVNGTVGSFPDGAMEKVDAEDRRRKSFEKIAEYIDFVKYKGENNINKLYTAEGVTLVGDSEFFLKYNPRASVDELLKKEPFESIVVSYYKDVGVDAQFNREIVSAGSSPEVTHNLKGGKLKGLLDLRDVEIPKILDQLDILAKNMKEQFNKVHNEGNAFSPPTDLNGTTNVARDQYLGFSGKLKLSVVNELGKAHPGIQAVDIDLDKLDTGEGAGRANIQGLMREIDYHFGSKLTSMNKVNYLSAVDDVKLAFTSNDVNPSSTFTMDLDVSNLSNTDATVSIISATAVDNSANNILGGFNAASSVINAGTVERTTNAGPSITINTPASLDYPFTVTLGVRVNDGITDNDATITYTINASTPDPLNGYINNRVGATAVAGAASLVAPTTPSAVMTSTLLGGDGQPLAINSNEMGTFAIRSNSDDYKIVLDDSASLHTGVIGTSSIGTNEKLSYYFGLNDFFVKTSDKSEWGDLKNTAYYLDVRNDLKMDASKLASGKLKEKINHADPSSKTHEYEVYEGDNENLLNLISLSNDKIFFAGAGTLPPTTVSVKDYAAEIIGFNTAQFRMVLARENESGVVRRALVDKIQNIKGVDINEEMANMVLYQQNFTASARMINAAREMDQIIIDLIK